MITTNAERDGEAVMTTTSVLGRYSEGSQSIQRQDLLTHANADQINTVSKMVLNLLKKRIPIDARTYGKLKRHKYLLREVGKGKNSVNVEENISSNRMEADSGVDYTIVFEHVGHVERMQRPRVSFGRH